MSAPYTPRKSPQPEDLMNAKDAIHSALGSTRHMLEWYVSDLSDADLLVRPVPAANHIAWQLTHLIHSEGQLGGAIPGAAYPTMPGSFLQLAKPEASASSDAKGYLGRQHYLDLFRAVRAATVEAVKDLSD